MKFEEQVLDRYGPAQVGFDHHRGDLTVYCKRPFALPRLSDVGTISVGELSVFWYPATGDEQFNFLREGAKDGFCVPEPV